MIVLQRPLLLYLSVLTDCGVGFLGVRILAASTDSAAETVRTVLGARLLVALTAIAGTAITAMLLLPRHEASIIIAYSLILVTVALGTRWVHVGLGQPGSASIGRIAAEVVTAIVVLAVVRGRPTSSSCPRRSSSARRSGRSSWYVGCPRRSRRSRGAPPAVVRDLLGQSWPLVLHALLGLVIFNSDLVFLRAFRDSASVGFYAAAYALISFGLNLGSAYTMSLLP